MVWKSEIEIRHLEIETQNILHLLLKSKFCRIKSSDGAIYKLKISNYLNYLEIISIIS